MPAFKVFIGNLAESTKSNELRSLFEKCGTVVECHRFIKFGIVFMQNEHQGRDAIHNLNGSKIHGNIIRVEAGVRRKAPNTPTIFVDFGNQKSLMNDSEQWCHWSNQNSSMKLNFKFSNRGCYRDSMYQHHHRDPCSWSSMTKNVQPTKCRTAMEPIRHKETVDKSAWEPIRHKETVVSNPAADNDDDAVDDNAGTSLGKRKKRSNPAADKDDDAVDDNANTSLGKRKKLRSNPAADKDDDNAGTPAKNAKNPSSADTSKVAALRQSLSALGKKQLSALMETIGLDYGMGRTKEVMIEEILKNHHPAKFYTCKRMRDLHFDRFQSTIRNQSTALTIAAIQRKIPNFDGIQRPEMTGDEWYVYVQFMLNFFLGSAIMHIDHFQFTLTAWRSELASLDLTEQENRQKILTTWNYLKLLPQFTHYLSETQRQQYQSQMDAIIN